MSWHARAKERAVEINAALRCDDARLRGSARIVHHDGSVFHLESAFLLRWEDPEGGTWIFGISEHHAPLVYVEEDLADFRQYGPRSPVARD